MWKHKYITFSTTNYMGSKNKKLNLDKDLLYDLYINQKMTSKEVGELFNCSSKTIRNYLIKYGIPVRQNGEAVKLERSKWSSDKELQRSRNVHKAWSQKSPEEIAEITRKKYLSGRINSPEAILKANNTKKLNGTSKESKAESNFYNKLLIQGFDSNDIERHYSDTRYPFDCDFYIKSKDLFIEYQGHQSHGYEPYNINSIEHEDYLNYMLYKGEDMSTWIKRDPKKLKVALENKINLLLIYPKHNTYLVKDGNIKNIGKSNMIDINDIY